MSGGRAYSIWARRLFNARQRCASHLLAIDTLDRLADHAGQIVGYSRRSLGPELGVKRRQAFNILDELARQGLIVAEARFSERGQQLANCYRWLAPWILAQIEGEERAAELPPAPEIRRLTWMELRERRLKLSNELADPP